jgi:regulator of sigma E protease
MEIWIKAAQLFLSLAILVSLHELGHFIPAKLFKTRIEKFYLFFNPGFSLFRYKRINGIKKYSWFTKESPKEWKEDESTTEWGIGWLPLGGYVKIAGMIDESMDKEQLEKPAEPWEFRSKPAWQRLIVMIGGVVVNLLLGFFIYSMVLFIWGTEYLPNENAVYGTHLTDESMANYGLYEGDKIISADGMLSEKFGDINQMIVIDGARNLKVLRNNEEKQITLPKGIVDTILSKKLKGVISGPRYPNVIKELIDTMPAIKAGLQVGDSIIEINGLPCSFLLDFQKEMQNHKSQEINLGFYRNNEKMNLSVMVTENGTIGYYQMSPDDLLSFKTQEFGFIEAIPAGISEGTETLSNYVKSMSLLFTKEGVKQIGGFGTIGGIFPGTWDWKRFWLLTAFLSIILAFMNILPIPALDGGHVVFLIYEMISGKPPSENFLTKAQVVGMVLLLTLLVYANGMDIYRWISGS